MRGRVGTGGRVKVRGWIYSKLGLWVHRSGMKRFLDFGEICLMVEKKLHLCLENSKINQQQIVTKNLVGYAQEVKES